MHLRLVSNPGCPFVHRAAIMLLEKGVAYEVETVDLANKPQWFTEISPRGKVPVLIADGTPIFESTAICEFLEETHPDPPLFPRDPILRARDRGWFAFIHEELNRNMWVFVSTKSEDERRNALDGLHRSLARLNDDLSGREWLSGDGRSFGMADVFAAPFFVRSTGLEKAGIVRMSPELAAVSRYADRVRARKSVIESTAPGLEERMRKFIAAPPP